MKPVPRRLRRLDPLLLLALVVGAGAVISTSAQAQERTAHEHAELMVSYQGALPALRKRLGQVALQADGLLRGVLPAESRPVSLSLSAPEIRPAVATLEETGGFVAEQDTAMTFIFRRDW